jgi:endonuclease/exonuclease/phosphatase family metal-dependent hydrolase
MLIVSWNMARNTTSKSAATHERAWHYLASLGPDIALVQEATPPEWSGDIWERAMVDVTTWGSAVLAKGSLGLKPLALRPEVPWERDGYIASASVTLPDGTSLSLGSVHAPLLRALSEEQLAGYSPSEIKLPGYTKAWYYDVPFAIYREELQGSFLVSGDWNVSPDLWDDLHANSHEGEFFLRAAEHGWRDIYRQFHSSEGRTWFRKGDPPYQPDHAFCDSATAARIRSCEIDEYPAVTLKVSDHAPLLIEMDV